MSALFQKDQSELKVVVQKEGEKPRILREANPKHFTVGSSVHCSLTLDHAMLSKQHRLIRYRRGRPYLLVPQDVPFELSRGSAKKTEEAQPTKVSSALLRSVGVLERQNGCYIVPFEAPTQVLLKFGSTKLALEFLSGGRLPSETFEGLPQEMRKSEWSESDLRFSMISCVLFVLMYSCLWLIAQHQFPPRVETIADIDKRYAELIIETPVKTTELFREFVKEQEEEKVPDESTKPKPKEPTKTVKPTDKKPSDGGGLKSKGLFAALDGDGGFKGVLENKNLNQAFQGVGVLTTKRPAGQTIAGPAFASRDAVNVDDMAAGIAARQQSRDGEGGAYGSGGLGKRTTKVDNPFEISGSGKGHHLRSYGEIDRVIRQHLDGVRLLYERYLRKNPGMRGRVNLKFVIDAQGKVTQCSVVQSSLGDAEFVQQLVSRISMWRFPTIESQYGSVAVEYPFTFLPKGSS